jgi:cardiolipin synthase (CMP-forming)
VLLAQVDGMQWVGQLRLIALDATMALTILSGLHYAWIASHKTPHAAANGVDAQSKN